MRSAELAILVLFFLLFWDENALNRFRDLIASSRGRRSDASGLTSWRLWRQLAGVLALISMAARITRTMVKKQALVIPHKIVVALGRLSHIHVHL